MTAQQVAADLRAAAEVRHFLNLTNGLACPHAPSGAGIVRIQSTWCEQKRWGDVLLTASPELLFRLAQGDRCVIHDVSERPRETRACWQGLSWLRYALTRAWSGTEIYERSRGGMVVSAYWREQYSALGPQPRAFARYFGRHWTGGPVRLESCYAADAAEAQS